jgi:hypothetical protein
MTPGRGQAWKSHARFPHPQPSYYYEFIFSCQVCWRTMRWHNGRTRRSENPYPEEVFKTAKLMGRRTQRIPSWPGATAPTKAAYICADQPVTFTFRLQQGGGPYIPDSRQSSRYAVNESMAWWRQSLIPLVLASRQGVECWALGVPNPERRRPHGSFPRGQNPTASICATPPLLTDVRAVWRLRQNEILDLCHQYPCR